MMARFLYRVVALVFLLLAIALWLGGCAGIIVQFSAQGFHLSAFALSIVAFVLSMMMMDASNEAWRAARIHHVRYD